MSDLPTQNLLQQLNARQVSGEHLELLGKKAASMWTDGTCSTLNEAVVSTVKEAGLSPEQVKRVVEFTNTAAYLTEFNKEGSPNKYVNFGSSGPASSAVILQDLNDGGGGSVFDPGNGDYHQPPESRTKSASAVDELSIGEMFKTAGHGDYPEENPLGDVLTLREKLASTFDSSTSVIIGLEGMVHDLRERLFSQVKQAALAGHGLGEIVDIWGTVAPDEEYVKVAFSMIMDRLLENGVFRSSDEMAESLQKTASSTQIVNQEHPLVVDFQEFCETIDKLASLREERDEVGRGLEQLMTFLKSANEGGLLQKGLGALSTAAGKADIVGQHAGSLLLGAGKGKAVGTAAKALTYAAPVVAANEVYRRTLKHNPTFQSAKGNVLGAIPGTSEYRNKELELAMGGYPQQY